MVLGPRRRVGTPAKRPLRRGSVLLSHDMQEVDLPAKTLISIIDDDKDFRDALQGLMTSMGFTVEAFSSALDFLARMNIRDTSCLIVGVNVLVVRGCEPLGWQVAWWYVIRPIVITC